MPPAPRTYHPSCCVYLLGKNAPMLRSHLLRKCRQTRADKKWKLLQAAALQTEVIPTKPAPGELRCMQPADLLCSLHC